MRTATIATAPITTAASATTLPTTLEFTWRSPLRKHAAPYRASRLIAARIRSRQLGTVSCNARRTPNWRGYMRDNLRSTNGRRRHLHATRPREPGAIRRAAPRARRVDARAEPDPAAAGPAGAHPPPRAPGGGLPRTRGDADPRDRGRGALALPRRAPPRRAAGPPSPPQPRLRALRDPRPRRRRAPPGPRRHRLRDVGRHPRPATAGDPAAAGPGLRDARGGIRTHMSVRTAGFKPAAYLQVPPPGRASRTVACGLRRCER